MAAAVTEKKNPSAKYESAVDEQIAQATSRIRVHDLAFGGLLLAALLLAYTTAMIVLDRYLVLSEWVRQLALAGLLVSAGGIAYATLIRPLRRRVNPLYAAVQVEKTIEDAKNSVVGYVEAQENGTVHPTVKAAMSARAAKSVGKADVNRAVDHRSLVFTGAAGVVFLLALVVLFFVFRPAQFASLVGRTFAPFSTSVIASQTLLTVTEPAGGDTTVTAGQAVTIKVQVGGKIPSSDRPDRVRVLLRHSQASTEAEEVTMEKGENSREWQARIPDYLVRNGFWYRVAGGDAETAEYRVSVRSLPLFTEFEVSYDYPAYTRRAPESPTKDPHLEAYRGTKVIVVGKTNRTVRDGRVVFEPPGRDPVVGTVPPGRPDSLRFEFYLTTSGTYKVFFSSADGERNVDPPPYGIRVLEDEAPRIDIVKPEEDEITIPANGQLAVDARLGDDFGIDRVWLKLSLPGKPPVLLAGKPYQDGQSFRRAKDGTWPTALEYKDSVDLAQLKDAAGKPIELKEGMVVEYWLEATDNRTRPGPNGPEPDPNVGRSRIKKVLVAAPVVVPEQKEKADAHKQERQAEERQHNQNQQKRLANEKRTPNQKPNPNQPQPPEETKQPPDQGADQPMGMPESGMNKPDESTKPKGGEPKKDGPKTPPEPKAGPDQPPMPMDGMGEPMMPPQGGKPMSEPGMGGMGQPNPAPMPSDPGQNQKREDVKNQAQRVQDELNREAQGGEPGKSGPPPEADRTNPGEAKPPMPGGEQPNDPPKEGPKPNDPANPTASGMPPKSNPADKPEKPTPSSEPKPEPGMSGEQGSPPSADDKNQKGGGAAGADKETPKTQPNTPQDASGGGSAKPASGQKNTPEQGGQPMPNPADNASQPKPMPQNDPGMDREPAGNPMGGNQPENGAKPDGGGDAKPMAKPESAGSKPNPKGSNPMGGGGEPKPAPMDQGAGEPMGQQTPSAETKPDGNRNPMGGTAANSPEKGSDKPRPDQSAGQPGEAGSKNPEKGPNGSGGQQRKLDPKQEQELKNALNDLTSPDENRRKAAQDKLDKMVGEQNRKEIEDIAKGLNSDDKQERAAAEKKLNDLKDQMKKAGQEPKGGGTAGQSKPDPKDVDNALKDLKSSDPKTREAAREKLDKAFGQGTGQQAEKDQQKAQSGNKQERDDAQNRLDNLKKQANEMAKGGGTEPKNDPNKTPGAGGQKPDPKEVEKAVNGLNDADPKKREEAKQKLDEMFGQGAGQQAEDLARDLKSNDPKTREAAQNKLNDLKKQAEQQAKKGGGGEPKKEPSGAGQKPDPKEVEKAVNGLNDTDPKKREEAKQKLDEMFGQGAGQQAEDLARDLKSNDPKTREAAQNKLNDLMKQAKNSGQPKKESAGAAKKADPKEVERALDELNDADPKKRAAAKEKLDEMLGKGQGQKAEENAKKLNSGNLEEEAKARKERDEMIRKAEEMAKNGRDQQPGSGKQPTPEELDDLAKKAEDLNSKDEAKRKAAEEALDQKLGEQNRKKLQEEMKNQAGSPQQQADETRKQLDEMAKQPGGAASRKPDGNRVPKGPPGSSDEKLKEAMKEDIRNRALSADRQLETFEKNKHNKDLLNRLNMKEGDYNKFLEEYRNEVARLKQEAAEAEKAGPQGTPAGPPTGNVSEARKVEGREGPSSSAAGAGALFAAPGYADAMKKFQEDLAKGAKVRPK